MKKNYTLSIYHEGFDRGTTDTISYTTKKEALYAFKWKKYEHKALQLDLFIVNDDGDIIEQITLRTAENGKATLWRR